MARRGSVEGIDELIGMFRELGKVPQKSVRKAARAGAKIPLKAAKAKAPVRTRQLKKGLKLVKEKRQKLGKEIFQVTFDAAKSDVFVKKVENPTSFNRSSDPNRAYYPASQEHGFYNHWAKRFIPGLHFMRKSIDDNDEAIREKTLDVLGKDIDKALRG